MYIQHTYIYINNEDKLSIEAKLLKAKEKAEQTR